MPRHDVGARDAAHRPDQGGAQAGGGRLRRPARSRSASSSGSVRGRVCQSATPKIAPKKTAPPAAKVSTIGRGSAASSLTTVATIVARDREGEADEANAAHLRLPGGSWAEPNAYRSAGNLAWNGASSTRPPRIRSLDRVRELDRVLGGSGCPGRSGSRPSGASPGSGSRSASASVGDVRRPDAPVGGLAARALRFRSASGLDPGVAWELVASRGSRELPFGDVEPRGGRADGEQPAVGAVVATRAELALRHRRHAGTRPAAAVRLRTRRGSRVRAQDPPSLRAGYPAPAALSSISFLNAAAAGLSSFSASAGLIEDVST